MRATGIVRRIDDLGRVVIPKEIRRAMKIREGDPLEIYTYNGCVCFKKYSRIGEFEIQKAKTIVAAIIKGRFILLDRDAEQVFADSASTMADWEDDPNQYDGAHISLDGDHIGTLYAKDPNTLAYAAKALEAFIAD